MLQLTFEVPHPFFLDIVNGRRREDLILVMYQPRECLFSVAHRRTNDGSRPADAFLRLMSSSSGISRLRRDADRRLSRNSAALDRDRASPCSSAQRAAAMSFQGYSRANRR